MEKYEEVRQILLSLYDNRELKPEKKRKLYDKYLKGMRYLAYRGNPEAQFDLAGHYEDIGFWGIPNPYQNDSKCFYWYSKAVYNGHVEACNNLAALYETGRGCEINLEQALSLYKQASELGSASGVKNYKTMKRQMK